jgi:hypothetical protein
MVRINIPTSYGSVPEGSAPTSTGSKARRMQMFLALASVGLCLVVVASFASSSSKLSNTFELLDASSESGECNCTAATNKFSRAASTSFCPWHSATSFRPITRRCSRRVCRQQGSQHWQNLPCSAPEPPQLHLCSPLTLLYRRFSLTWSRLTPRRRKSSRYASALRSTACPTRLSRPRTR